MTGALESKSTTVLATFLVAETKYSTLKVEGGKVYLAHNL